MSLVSPICSTPVCVFSMYVTWSNFVEVYNQGPLSAIIDASSQEFEMYTSGVFTQVSGMFLYIVSISLYHLQIVNKINLITYCSLLDMEPPLPPLHKTSTFAKSMF